MSYLAKNKKMNKIQNEPLVSILMNCYNGEKYLHEAIDSVIAQTYKNWEIVFWDNCSTCLLYTSDAADE